MLRILLPPFRRAAVVSKELANYALTLREFIDCGSGGMIMWLVVLE
jgi:hypothetical protein